MLLPRVLGPSAAPADFLEADAVAAGDPARAAADGPFELRRVEVQGGQVARSWVLLGQRHPDNLPFEDLWVTSDGARAHFRVTPAEGVIPAGAPGLVRVVFARVRDGAEIVATARFTTGPDRTLVLPSGASTSRASFYTGPSNPMHEAEVAASPPVHVGRRHWDAAANPEGTRSRWSILPFDTWLDDSLPRTERVDGPPQVTVGAGRVHVFGWEPKGYYRGRHAQLEFDPRDPAHRLIVGSHRLAIRWTTRSGAKRTTHEATACIVVRDDGTSEVARCAP
jgi:hypothetical protein